MAQIWLDDPGQWVDGTSNATIVACLQKIYTEVSASSLTCPTSGRFSRKTLYLNGSSTVSKTFDAPAPSGAEGYAGYWGKLVEATLYPNGLMVSNNSGPQISFVINATTGVIQIRLGSTSGTILGSTTFAVQGGQAYYFEYGWLLSQTAGEAWVRVNNDEKLHVSGVDTCFQTGTDWNKVSWIATRQYISDMYVNDGSGGVNDGFRGDSRVDPHFVNAAGDSAQFTPSAGSNYQCVDENPASESDYNTSDAIAELDLYNLEAFKATGGLITGVALWLYLSKTDAGAAAARGHLKMTSDHENPTSKYPAAGNYTYFTYQYDVSPESSSAFTESEFNSMQAGLGRTE